MGAQASRIREGEAFMTDVQWGEAIAFPLGVVIAGLCFLPMFWQPARGRHRR